MGSLDSNPASFDAFAGAAEGFQPLNADDVRSYLHKSVDFIYDYYKSVTTTHMVIANSSSPTV